MRRMTCLLSLVLTVPVWGQALGSEFQVNTYTTGRQYQYGRAVASAPDGSFMVVWESGSSYAVRDVRGRRFDASGVALGGEFAINSYTTGPQYRAAVAANDSGEFLVVWQSLDQDGSGPGVFGQAFSAGGGAVGSEFLISDTTLGNQVHPRVAGTGDGTFVVSWLSTDGDSGGVFARRFDASGAAIGFEFQVNNLTAGSQYTAAIAGDRTGGFIVAWAGPGPGDSSGGVWARRFDRTNSPPTSQFKVNSNNGGVQYVPSIGIAATGDFVVAWGSGTSFTAFGQDGSFGGIFAQRFDNGGGALGSEFQVNSFTTGYQIRPALGVAASGAFTVAWASVNQDGSSGGIFGQLYEADGSPRDNEFQVNSYTSNAQRYPSIGMAPNGRFVVAWNSFYQDGSHFGVHAQRYTLGDSTPPLVVAAIPNGGESWAAGTTRTVVWTATDDTALDHFEAFLSRDGGASFDPTPICSSLEPDQFCDWVVSGPASTTARVKVVAYDTSNNAGEDVSDGNFTITAAFVTVTAPDTTGIVWKAGTTKAIKFIHNLGKNQPVLIELNRNYPGGAWETLVNPALTTAALNSTFNWLVTGPVTNGATARVRVTPVGIPGVTDTSNANFTIDSRVKVTQPNTAVSWAAGSSKTIKWTHNFPTPHAFRIEIDRDGDLACDDGVIAASVNATTTTGSYAWTVAGTGSNNRICVTSTTDPLGADQSNVAFTITP